MSQWASATLQSTQSALPAWAQPALGPDALANPIVWMPPAALTCLFGATGGLRVLGMLVFFLALRRMFRLNTIRLRPVTLAWIVAMLVAWTAMMGVTGLGADDYDDYTELTPPTPAPVVDLDVAPPPAAANLPGRAWVDLTAVAAGDAGNATAVLSNKAEIDAALSEVYSAELRSQRIGGAVLVRMPLDEYGRVEQANVVVLSAPTTELGFVAASLAGAMRFDPAQPGGVLAGTSIDVTVHFEP